MAAFSWLLACWVILYCILNTLIYYVVRVWVLLKSLGECFYLFFCLSRQSNWLCSDYEFIFTYHGWLVQHQFGVQSLCYAIWIYSSIYHSEFNLGLVQSLYHSSVLKVFTLLFWSVPHVYNSKVSLGFILIPTQNCSGCFFSSLLSRIIPTHPPT